jgi:hypothetical protein
LGVDFWYTIWEREQFEAILLVSTESIAEEGEDDDSNIGTNSQDSMATGAAVGKHQQLLELSCTRINP